MHTSELTDSSVFSVSHDACRALVKGKDMLELEKASVGGWDFLPEVAARALLWSHRMVSSSDCEPPKYMPYALALGSITFALNVTHDSGGGMSI